MKVVWLLDIVTAHSFLKDSLYYDSLSNISDIYRTKHNNMFDGSNYFPAKYGHTHSCQPLIYMLSCKSLVTRLFEQERSHVTY